jgi:hypothetical protein
MLKASADARAADWVVAGVGNFDHTVGSLVPAVFEAYARVFHPAARTVAGEAVAVRWAEVALANGRVMHPAAEWGSIVGPWEDRSGSRQGGVWDEPPETGTLPHAAATRLAEVLAGHTKHEEHCSFALWQGQGTIELLFLFKEGTPESERRQAEASANASVESWRALVESGASFTLPHREMWLLNGPLAAIGDFYECHRHPSALWWPGDRAWCVATDTDLMTTYVGASHECVEALLADEELEVFGVPVDQRVTWDADTINPQPWQPES